MTPALPRPYRLDVHPRGFGAGEGLAADARVGLRAGAKWMPPVHFYDERGSALFEEITRLPEYYQGRTELEILERVAPALVARHGVAELVELGSGASRKTRALLDAMRGAGTLERYVPFDVCPEAILAAASALAEDYPGLDLHGVAGDFGRHLPAVPPRAAGGARLIAFLGGTIGNLEPAGRAPFLRSVAALMDDDDVLLVGTDLAGDPGRILPAYDDAAGVTAQFNLNLLRVMNRELDGDFDLDAFAHVARYDPGPPWIEMRLRAIGRQVVRLAALDMTVEFADGEEMRTEISCKFTRDSVAGMYGEAGLRIVEWHEDPRGWFAVSLARRASRPGGRPDHA
ncbi:MAG TPA: L-histidine N(alpha)-methyltransferase [Miltoncostaeaceae bacterium]|nr:L-histidine N(alpha)-methyltransferase [Miltoncostaeaceae bacterium]